MTDATMLTRAPLTRKALQDALDHVGVVTGDLILVKADLAYAGPIEGVSTKAEHVETVYDVLRSQIGREGTLVVPTSSERLCSSGGDFILEETPSQMGMLSEWIRQRPGARRSLHPFVSYTAEGPLAEAIVEDVAKNSFGPDTPKARLIDLGAKVVNLGIPPNQTNSVVHHAEQMMGVPYRYHKEFPNKVIAGGRYIGTDYLMYVRRLECRIEIDITKTRRVFQVFRQCGHAIAEVPIGATGVVTCFDLRAMFEACIALLKQDIYGLLVKPPEHRPYRGTC